MILKSWNMSEIVKTPVSLSHCFLRRSMNICLWHKKYIFPNQHVSTTSQISDHITSSNYYCQSSQEKIITPLVFFKLLTKDLLFQQ